MTKYDPNVKYGWEKETPFTLNGNEFGLILNTFRTVLSTPEAQKYLMLAQANTALDAVLQRNVESGIIKPSVEEGSQSPGSQPNMTVVKPEDTKPVPKKRTVKS